MSNREDLISEFKNLLDEHGTRSPLVRDFLDAHPEVQRLVDSIMYRESVQIVPIEYDK